MNRQQIWLCDEDETYALRLARYVNERENLPLTIRPYTDPKALSADRSRAGGGLLVISEKLLLQFREPLQELIAGTGRLFVLAEEIPSPNRAALEECRMGQLIFLHKYMAAPELVRQILRERETAGAGAGNVIGVYSPIGRCGKSAFAFALGEILGETRRTLLVNMEEYPWLGIDEEPPGDKPKPCLSDLLYEIAAGQGEDEQTRIRERFPEHVREAVRTGRHLDYLRPPRCGGDIGDAGIGEWELLVQALCACSGYEIVILDLGAQIRDVQRLLRLCGRIYMPVLQDPYSRCKLERFDRTLLAADGGSCRDRILPLVLPPPPAGTPRTPEDLAHTGLGGYIRGLLEKERKRRANR